MALGPRDGNGTIVSWAWTSIRGPALCVWKKEGVCLLSWLFCRFVFLLFAVSYLGSLLSVIYFSDILRSTPVRLYHGLFTYLSVLETVY